jgi:DNA-binding transcriptional LysR family regulator
MSSLKARIGGHLSLRDLHVFLAVIEHGSMAKAASSLSVSRPVVSKTLAALEQSLGVALLDRNKRGIAPTIFGQALSRRGAAIFEELRHGIEELNVLADPASGEVRIGCTEIMAAGFIGAVIDELAQSHPRMTFRLEIGNAATRIELLRQRRCELIVGRHVIDRSDTDLSVESLFHEQSYLVVGAKHRLARAKKVSLADTTGERWILTRDEIEPGTPLAKAFEGIGRHCPAPEVVSDSFNLRNKLLPTGRYISTLPGSILKTGSASNAFVVLPVKLPSWHLPIGIVTLANSHLAPTAATFVECARRLNESLMIAKLQPTQKRRG